MSEKHALRGAVTDGEPTRAETGGIPPGHSWNPENGRLDVWPPRLGKLDVAMLRRPFAVVKFMPQGTLFAKSDGVYGGRFLAHLDSSLVCERLSDVDPEWHATYERLGSTYSEWKAADFATACHLTVKGVTRTDIGRASSIEGMKGAYSDSLKRAALRFGVGSYLRDASWEFWMDSKITDATGKQHEAYTTRANDKGKQVVRFLKPAGKAQLRHEYESVLARPSFADHYGQPVHYGDVDDDLQDDATAELAASAPPDPDLMSDLQVELLAMVSTFNGRKANPSQRAKWESMPSEKFVDQLGVVMVAVSGNLGLAHSELAELRVAIGNAAASGHPGQIEHARELLKDWADRKAMADGNA